MTASDQTASRRLESLDVLRGFDMFFIFLPDPAPCICAVALAAGLFISFAPGSWSCPIHKANWSTSFVLVSGGCSFALLSVFYWLVDIRGYRRWGFFFKVIGMNSITIYILMRTVLNYDFEKLFFFGGLARFIAPAWHELVSQTGLIALGWLLLYYLYRKNIFLRV